MDVSSKDIQKARRSAMKTRAAAACLRCKSAKSKCNVTRPCDRCTKRGHGISCREEKNFTSDFELDGDNYAPMMKRRPDVNNHLSRHAIYTETSTGSETFLEHTHRNDIHISASTSSGCIGHLQDMYARNQPALHLQNGIYYSSLLPPVASLFPNITALQFSTNFNLSQMPSFPEHFIPLLNPLSSQYVQNDF